MQKELLKVNIEIKVDTLACKKIRFVFLRLEVGFLYVCIIIQEESISAVIREQSRIC